MKKFKKMLVILLIVGLIIANLSFVNATNGDSNDLTISNGTRENNIVTFIITLPNDGGLNGDANDNGRVDEYADFDAVTEGTNRPEYKDYNVDAYLILGYIAEINKKEELNMILADYNLDGNVDINDDIEMQSQKELLTNPIKLNGTLAQDSTYKMSKTSNNTYKVEVKVPEGKDGTIGITVKQKVFKISQTVANEEKSSTMLNVNNSEKNPTNITISDGIKNGNNVIFKINLPEGTNLRGDVNTDGKVDLADVDLLTKFLNKEITEGIDDILADVNGDGSINSFDSSALKKIVSDNSDSDKTNDSIILNGDLAEKASYKLVKDSNGKFSVEVTIPEDITKGTIGVTLADGIFMNKDKTKSVKVSSNLFNYSKSDKSEEFKVTDKKEDVQDNGKIKVTITTNKELDSNKIPNGWTLGEDGKSIWKVMDKNTSEDITLVAKDGSTIKYTVTVGDKTTAPGKIPQTGIKNTIIFIVAGIAIVGIVVFIRSKKILK